PICPPAVTTSAPILPARKDSVPIFSVNFSAARSAPSRSISTGNDGAKVRVLAPARESHGRERYRRTPWNRIDQDFVTARRIRRGGGVLCSVNTSATHLGGSNAQACHRPCNIITAHARYRAQRWRQYWRQRRPW